MSGAFHMRTFNRKMVLHASIPNGGPERPRHLRAPNEMTWAVIHDPSGTIKPSARFGKLDLDMGAKNNIWETGTIFMNICSRNKYYYDPLAMKIRKLETMNDKKGTKSVPVVVVVTDYAKKITVNGQAATFTHCPTCVTVTPHQNLGNGKQICGFCGTEH